jgi:hypothetical protein
VFLAVAVCGVVGSVGAYVHARDEVRGLRAGRDVHDGSLASADDRIGDGNRLHIGPRAGLGFLVVVLCVSGNLWRARLVEAVLDHLPVALMVADAQEHAVTVVRADHTPHRTSVERVGLSRALARQTFSRERDAPARRHDEPRNPLCERVSLDGPGWIRTIDRRIMSPLL